MNQTPAPSPAPIESWEVLDLLASLVQKSLVVYEEDEQGQGRYRLLETVRQYARERLVESGGGQALRDRHRDWCVALAEEVDQGLNREGEQERLNRLEQERDNLRAALEWSEAQGQAEPGLRLVAAMGVLWAMRGYFGEGREQFARLLDLPGAKPRTVLRAKALHAAGFMARHQGDYDEARAFLEAGLAIFRELDVKQGIAQSLWSMGHLAERQADYGIAQAHLEESLTIFRELDDKPGIGRSLRGLAAVAHVQGNDEAARMLLEESLAIARQLGSENDIAWSFYHLGRVAFGEGDDGRARAFLEESLSIFRELGHKPGLAHDLEKLAAVAGAQQQPERAARLFGAAEGLRAAIGVPLSSNERAEHDLSIAPVRIALGEEAFAAAWAAGRAMTLDQAISYALRAEEGRR